MTSQPCMACGAKLEQVSCKLRCPRCHTINETCGDGGEMPSGRQARCQYTDRQEARVRVAERRYEESKSELEANKTWENLRLVMLYPKLCDELDDLELGESSGGGKPPDSTPADDGSPATHRQKD